MEEEGFNFLNSIIIYVLYIKYICRYSSGADGRYSGKNDGRYVHIAGKDGPGSVAAGKYVHVAGRDGPGSVAAGKYVHIPGKDGPGSVPAGKYVHVAGKDGPGSVPPGKYVHMAGKDGPGAAAYLGGSGGNAKAQSGTNGNAQKSSKKPIIPTTQRTIVTQGVPPTGWKIIRDEKTETIDGYHYL